MKTSHLAWIGFAALFCYVLIALCSFPSTIYVNVDGECYLSFFRQLYENASSPIDLSVNSGLEGMGELVTPLGVWLHPAALPLHFDVGVVAPEVASYFVVMSLAGLATFLLGRTLGMPTTLAVLSAQIQVIVFFPPLLTLYLDPIAPGFILPSLGHVSWPISVSIFFLLLLFQVGTRSTLGSITAAICMAALVIYSILCDPLWTVVFFLPAAPLSVGVLLGSENRRVLIWRILALVFCLFVLLSCNTHNYYRGLLGYAAREAFPNEIVGHMQTFDHFSGLFFESTIGAGLVLLLVACLAVTIARGSRVQRGFAAGTMLLCSAIVLLGVVYIYGGINWSKPPPSYFEHAALPTYIVGVILGLWTGWRMLADTSVGAGLRGWFDARFRKDYQHLQIALVSALPLVAGVVLIVFVERQDPTRVAEHQAQGTVFDRLIQSASHGPGDPFRGSVAIITDDDDAVGSGTLIHPSTLWSLRIPTLDDYTQLTTAPSYFFFSRTLAGLDDPEQQQVLQQKNTLMITQIRPKILAALGARYVMTFSDVDDPRLTLCCSDANDFGAELRLYEISEPNLGNYSPVNVHVVQTAQQVVERVVSDTFDFRTDVLLLESPGQLQLVPVETASMTFERGGVRVRARMRQDSAGQSMLVLPLQFSNSLKIVTPPDSNVRLLRANLIQTAVLFQGEIDIVIANQFGLFRDIAGRLQDLQDCHRYKVEEDGRISHPDGYQPHAILQW